MKQVQQQRLLGIGLLLLLVSIVAFLLINSTNENLKSDIEQQAETEQNFSSLIEPIGEAVETVDIEKEVLVDPHQLDEQPEQTKVTAQVTEKVAEKASADVAVKVESKPKPVSTTKPESQPKPAQKVSEAWAVQLASFGVKENAESLAKKVEQLGHDVELVASKSAGKTIYRVRLAAEKDKSVADAKAQILKKALKLTPQVLKVSN